MRRWLMKEFTSFLLFKSSREFFASVRNRLILASIVSLHDIARFIWASRTDRSREELDRSRLETEREELINESVGKNPGK